MLTRNDATVENALDLVEVARPLGLKHIGFKDLGADSALLRRLTVAVREAAASPWMEIVATTREAELRGVKLGHARIPLTVLALAQSILRNCTVINFA